MTDDKLIEPLRSGDLTLPEFLSQVEARYIEREPSILAFIPEADRFGRLHKESEALVSKYPDMITRPPLYGMLAGIKDIFHVDGFVTHAGSRLPSEELQGIEAESVTRLKNAGALIMGKTVTTEFAYFSPGPTRNPHNPEHTPGGSSSGSAAAVAAGLCSIALGTQTIGSIIRPAAFCGVIGLKPTYDRISRNDVIPLSPSLDHVGFFTPDVSTAKQVAASLYKDWDDSTALDRKPTLGIPDGPYLASASDYALTCFNAICNSLADAGYELHHIQVMDDFQEIRSRQDVIMSAEVAHVHADWFKKYENLYSPKFTELIRRGQAISVSQLQDAFTACDVFRDQISQTMNDNSIDLWICPPTIGPAPKGLESTGDPVMCLPWTQIGFPAINIPTTKTEDGLPMGLQLVGKWNSDESLLALAEDIEKVVRKI
ncbi:MAG: amidase [Chloroflexi bacterium]|nr:amidase [Chloroflexota bacterium]MBI3170059.1 amidase [Chloroflexota bacterium]